MIKRKEENLLIHILIHEIWGLSTTWGMYTPGTHRELDALTRQIGEQVGSGGQTSWRHAAVGRVRELVEAPSGKQAACGAGAGEEAHQKMHAVLLSGANTTHTVNTSS